MYKEKCKTLNAIMFAFMILAVFLLYFDVGITLYGVSELSIESEANPYVKKLIVEDRIGEWIWKKTYINVLPLFILYLIPANFRKDKDGFRLRIFTAIFLVGVLFTTWMVTWRWINALWLGGG